MILKKLILCILFSMCIFSCSTKKNKSDIDIDFVQDTLNVGYTYWWAESGPFIGNCGEEISLTFTGTVVELDMPNDAPGPLYTSQKGIVAIENVFKIKELGANTYANQKFISTDCFYNLNLNIGDKVIVFCYDYEDNYVIPGRKSILKIEDFDAPIITSIKNYIDFDQDPFSIEKDEEIWKKYKLDKNLEQLIFCAKEMDALKHEN